MEEAHRSRYQSVIDLVEAHQDRLDLRVSHPLRNRGRTLLLPQRPSRIDPQNS